MPLDDCNEVKPSKDGSVIEDVNKNILSSLINIDQFNLTVFPAEGQKRDDNDKLAILVTKWSNKRIEHILQDLIHDLEGSN